MKLITIIFLLLTIFGYSQQLNFRGESVNQIKIKYTNGFYEISKRLSIGIENLYKIEYDNNLSNYFVSEYSKTSFENSVEDSLKSKKHKKIIKTKKIIDKFNADSLLQSFNKSIYPINFLSLMISIKDFKKSTDKRNIKQIIKKNNKYIGFIFKLLDLLDWWTIPKINKNELISSCQNIDTLNYYLKSQFDSSGFAITNDYWDDITVEIVTENKIFFFESTYPNTFRQPWYDNNNNKLGLPKNILNPDINRQLLKILPMNYFSNETLQNKSLIIGYIKWFLNRRNIISLMD
jgi:hypothetical protein